MATKHVCVILTAVIKIVGETVEGQLWTMENEWLIFTSLRLSLMEIPYQVYVF